MWNAVSNEDSDLKPTLFLLVCLRQFKAFSTGLPRFYKLSLFQTSIAWIPWLSWRDIGFFHMLSSDMIYLKMRGFLGRI